MVLGCLGYGSVFLLLSMMFRNPMPGAMLLLGWEAINPVMPSLLQKFSVASYLRHLMPVSVPAEGIFALLTVETEPVSAWVAALGLLASDRAGADLFVLSDAEAGDSVHDGVIGDWLT